MGEGDGVPPRRLERFSREFGEGGGGAGSYIMVGWNMVACGRGKDAPLSTALERLIWYRRVSAPLNSEPLCHWITGGCAEPYLSVLLGEVTTTSETACSIAYDIINEDKRNCELLDQHGLFTSALNCRSSVNSTTREMRPTIMTSQPICDGLLVTPQITSTHYTIYMRACKIVPSTRGSTSAYPGKPVKQCESERGNE